MGRKPLPDNLRKENLTISIRKETIDRLKTITNYNSLIQKLLDDYFKKE